MQGKIALVTGATRGIGRAVAEELVSKGAFVIGTATSEKGAESISAYLGEKGKGLVLNVADQASIDAVLEQIKQEFGDIDILVNNAGITRDNLLMRMKDEEWFDILQTNLSSVYHLSKAMLHWFCRGLHGQCRSDKLLCGKSRFNRFQQSVGKRSGFPWHYGKRCGARLYCDRHDGSVKRRTKK